MFSNPNHSRLQVSSEELIQLCKAASNTLQQERTLVEVKPPVTVVGDVHGQYSDLLRIFNIKGFPSVTNYVFLGGESFPPSRFPAFFLRS